MQVSLPILESFMCPINKEILHDPVQTVDGMTYERGCIERWFQLCGGRPVAPLTNLPLASDEVMPNVALKGAIEEYLKCRPANAELLRQKDLEIESLNSKVESLKASALDVAVKAGDAEACRRLVRRGCQVNSSSGNTLQPTALFLAACRGHCTVLSTLLELRADMSHQNVKNRTAIFSAVQSGHSQSVRLLLESQANVSHVDCRGQTPLFFAARLSCEESVRLLLAARAAARISNQSQRSPLFYAVKDTRVAAAKLLLAAGDLSTYRSAELANMAQQRGIHELADRLRQLQEVEEKAQREAEPSQQAKPKQSDFRFEFDVEDSRGRKHRRVTYGSAEYVERLQQLQEHCPWLRNVWSLKDE